MMWQRYKFRSYVFNEGNHKVGGGGEGSDVERQGEVDEGRELTELGIEKISLWILLPITLKIKLRG